MFLYLRKVAPQTTQNRIKVLHKKNLNVCPALDKHLFHLVCTGTVNLMITLLESTPKITTVQYKPKQNIFQFEPPLASSY
jgi:hypothetical protein